MSHASQPVRWFRTLIILLLFASTVAAASPATASSDPGPGFAAPDGTVPTAWFEPDDPDAVTVSSATGCNVDVCIALTGSGLTVDKWETRGYVTGAQCSYARYLRNDSVIATSGTVCSSGAGWLVSTWNNPGTFADGTILCNTWSGITGKPCKTVQA